MKHIYCLKNKYQEICLDKLYFVAYNVNNKKSTIEVAMQMSSMWRRHPRKHMKGNHRRITTLGIELLWGYMKYI